MTVREFIPREHGAWAMWIVPMLSAAIVSRFSLNFFLLFVCFTLLYIVHHPVVSTVKRKSFLKGDNTRSIVAFALPAILLGIVLVVFAGRVWLLLFGAAEIAIFVFSIRAFLEKEQRSFVNELTVVASLTLSAPAAYYTITGLIDAKAVVLYALNFLFFGSSVFYIKMRIEFLRAKGIWKDGARKGRFMMLVYHLLLIVIVLLAGICGVVSMWASLGFVPMLAQVAAGTFSKETRVNFTRLGIALIFQSAIFLGVVGLFLR